MLPGVRRVRQCHSAGRQGLRGGRARHGTMGRPQSVPFGPRGSSRLTREPFVQRCKGSSAMDGLDPVTSTEMPPDRPKGRRT